jgi:UDP-glucose 4,6-dehydratase
MKNSVSHRYDFVNACLDLLLMKAHHGIYNIVNSGYISTAQVVQMMGKILNINKDFDFFESEKHFYEIGATAPRSNCILDNSKLTSSGIKIRSAEEAISDSLSNWKQ